MFSTERPNYLPKVTERGGLVPYWSPSLLKRFEKCPYSVKLRYVDKLKEPPSEAADRGIRIHREAEQYIRGELEKLPKEFKKFPALLRTLRDMYKEEPEKIMPEDQWAFDDEWNEVEWFASNVWCRVSPDVFIRENETSAIIYDWKSGKLQGNEITHAEQGIIYAMCAFQKYPELQFIENKFIYVDEDRITQKILRREQINILVPRLLDRISKLTKAKHFTPKPSRSACKFCYYNQSAICEFAIDD